ncbi:MAG: formylglycine-generating enzyme family protein [Candidatus Cloacimonetes bacterium]|nr:formylglycine-generating enzyme family protein [Candidatus Cloacimonadota bacterium]
MQTDLKIEDTFKEVRKSVIRETGNRQIPWDASCLADDFYFCMSCAPKTTEPEIVEPVAAKPRQNTGRDYTSSRGIEVVFVEGGSFQMGSNDGEDDEKPVHQVTVNNFYIGKYEVTQGLYVAIMGTNPSHFNRAGREAPVETVSWNDAVNFCNKLSEMDGLEKCYSGSGNSVKCDFNANGYRLPTEAEWEYAARGGNSSNGYTYSGSNDLNLVGWYGNSNSMTHNVGEKKPNELGIYDMSGNVWEWCWDWYDADYYITFPDDNPKGPGSGSNRVLRGGSWYIIASYCRVANRYDYSPSNTPNYLGFRLVRSSK